jgi:hypothetical protein
MEKTRVFEDEQSRPVHRKETEQQKLSKDIYSNAYRADQEPIPHKKLQSNNLFKTG